MQKHNPTLHVEILYKNYTQPQHSQPYRYYF
nr:MAG TPA: hypothetical protein [Caudoviricetes sp.]